MESLKATYRNVSQRRQTFPKQSGDSPQFHFSRAKPVVQSNLEKYWFQRYNLFSLYDQGILLDKELWWSVTPENIAKHIANRVADSLGGDYNVILDAFCGAGGNLIQFAKRSPNVRVIGCDNNLDRIKMAINNAKIYGVENQCDFICGDFLDVAKGLNGKNIDAVFLSPPWGGVEYSRSIKYSINSMTPNGFDLVKLCRAQLTPNIAFLMPRNVDLSELRFRLVDKSHQILEYEQNLVGTKVKTITVYMGALANPLSQTDSETD